MKILTVGLARTYYNKILEIHYNHGTQTKEQKIKEYKDILDKVMANVSTCYKDGYDFIYSERRSDKNPNGTVSAILFSCIQLVKSIRNEIEHNKVSIDYDLYKLCVKTLQKQ
ncbi:MAG: hypothetical protein LBU51_03260 [Bacteroidales bacterium]|jgi:hypothetical protein|nr:hypothetical protein [Bacteroidales bacterium]